MKTHAENTPSDALTAWRKAFFTKAGEDPPRTPEWLVTAEQRCDRGFF